MLKEEATEHIKAVYRYAFLVKGIANKLIITKGWKMKKLIVRVMFGICILMFQNAYGSASKTDSKQNAAVQKSMIDDVKIQSKGDGLIPILYEGKILKLKLITSKKYPTGFHSGVKNVGTLYASCADFVNPKNGDKIDVDFIVSKVGKRYHVVQPLIHSINGKKNPYDLE